MATEQSLNEQLHDLVASLQRHNYQTGKSSLPANGIYFFFEYGELAAAGDQEIERIVRVGTHHAEGGLPRRVRYHYSGKRGGSVFRQHLGGALLNQSQPEDPKIKEWCKQKGTPFPEIEALVSARLRDTFSYRCIRVDGVEDRLSMERGLIALLARHPMCPPSSEWLGRYAIHPSIKPSGLWNTQHVDAASLTPEEFDRLADLARDPIS